MKGDEDKERNDSATRIEVPSRLMQTSIAYQLNIWIEIFVYQLLFWSLKYWMKKWIEYENIS